MQIENEKLEPKKGLEMIGKMEKTANRIAKIVKGLKSVSRQGANDPFERVIVRDIFEESIAICEQKFKTTRVHLDVVNPDELWVSCRQGEIEQVVINLLNNSVDAIRNLKNQKLWVKLEAEKFEDMIRISVMDCGNGIEPEVEEKILQPFFTTKPVGQGTGLGLSISVGIAQGHGGRLFVDHDCENTRFVLEIPQRHTVSMSDDTDTQIKIAS